MPKAPLARPEAAPAAVEAKVPGMDFSTNPHHRSPVAANTKIARASCMGAGAIWARNHTPTGVAIRHPTVRGPSERQ